MSQSNRFPLCIDPHNQGLNWVKIHEKKNALRILSFVDTDYFIHLKKAIKYGTPIIFIDFENMDMDLKNVLSINLRCKCISFVKDTIKTHIIATTRRLLFIR